MSDTHPEILAEVEGYIRRVISFQESQERRIHKYIKRSRKGRETMVQMAQFGLSIPEDFRALYWNYNGAKPSDRLTMWESNIFLEFDWPQSKSLLDGTKIARFENQLHASDKLAGFHGSARFSIDLFPKLAHDSNVPLVANLGPLSKKTFIIFDSTLAMLRSVCAAQDAGLLSYQDAYVPPPEPGGRAIEPGQIRYDLKDLWEVIRPFNPRAGYWTAEIAGPIDWEIITPPAREAPYLVKLPPDMTALKAADD